MTEKQDNPHIDVDLLLNLHSGLEVLKSRQTEINRRIGALETGFESIEEALKESDKEKGHKWLDWFWQGVIWAVAITVAVTVGRLFGVEIVVG